VIPEGSAGVCMTKENQKGILYSIAYGDVSSHSINPIEKKPIYHFYPGSRWLSAGSMGCNFRGPGCQKLIDQMFDLSLKSGGCIKSDLKALDDNLRRALIGVSNQRTWRTSADQER
jgi:pyruvate-formate lyase-activating enzyme